MSYVPLFDHDLFLSYAHGDSLEWIRALEKSLRQQLQERLGDSIKIWQDDKQIRFGQNWTEEIQRGLERSAALLAVISPNYRASEWCDDERNIFLDHCKAANQLKAGSYHRFLKAIKTPWPDNDHEQFYPELEHIDFFEHRKTGGEIEDIAELVPGTREFDARIAQAAQAIASMLLQMRRSREAIFLAGATRDCRDARRGLVSELRARGYDVRPDGTIDAGHSADLIRKELKPALLSVHVLGAAYEEFVESQIKIALDLDKPIVFWLTREAESTSDARQAKLIDDIRLGRFQQDCEWLNLRSAQAFADHIIEKLKPRRVAAAPPPNGKARIYLLCDPTTPEDAAFSRDIQARIREQERMAVEVPVADSLAVHEQLLRDSDGLLLYRNSAPERWLYRTAEHVIHAETLSQRQRPCDSKGFLLTDPSVLSGSPVDLFRPSPEFTLNDIEPFLARLRNRSAHAA